MKNELIRQSALWLTILFLLLVGWVVLHLGPVGWIASIGLSSLPMRFWGHDHVTIVGIWSWLDDLSVCQASYRITTELNQSLMRTRTRTILSLVLFIGVPVPSFAGDPYEGFVKFSGHWKVRKCSLSSAPAFPDLGIGLTESRLNAVNVYFLNSKGKKAKLHFSTSSVNRDQGHITPESTREARIIVDRSDETGIRVSLQETGNVAVVEIIKTSATDLVYQRKMAGETFSCTFSSTAPE